MSYRTLRVFFVGVRTDESSVAFGATSAVAPHCNLARHYLVATLRRGHLTRTAHRPMRPIRQPVQTLGFIAGQPPVQCLTRHPRLLCGLRHRQTVTDHRLIPLLCTLNSLMRGVSPISRNNCHASSRNTVTHQPKTKCHASGEVVHLSCAPTRARTWDLRIKRAPILAFAVVSC